MRSRKSRGRIVRPGAAASRATASRRDGQVEPAATLPPQPASPAVQRLRWLTAGLLAVSLVWSFLPTLGELVRAWSREPDYSHGFLVGPLAVFFLWARRDRLPPLSSGLAWPGLILLIAAAVLHVATAAFYVEPLDGWALIMALAGVVWLTCGGRVCAWALPALAFLWFAVPLPFRAERLLSLPLQGIATKLSCWTLQVLGQPALAEGHTILLGDHQLAVEEACSGLRIFMSIVALACAYIILVRRSWWEKLFLLACTVPIALAVNAARIVLTAMLQQYVSGAAAAKFSHDLAGWIMIVLAAALFGAVLWYLGKLFREVEVMDLRSVLRSAKG